MQDRTAGRVVGKVKVVFAARGAVEEIVSDDGPSFDSSLTKQFADDNCQSVHPQANDSDVTERMQKQRDQVKVLMIYRSTPVQSIRCSLSKLLV